MVLTPALPGPPGPDLYPGTGLDPDPGLYPGPVLNSGPVVAAPGPGPAVPASRLPGKTGEPDDIITWYVRPRRRRRRRRLAMAAAVLAVTAWAGLLIWPASPAAHRPPSTAVPRPLGRAYALHPNAVIHLARARQHRRRQRIAQAAADTAITAAGGGAAAGLHSLRRPGTSWPRRGRPELPGPGPAGLTGINVLGWGCAIGVAGIASDGRYVWLACSDGLMFELDAATGAPVRVLAGPSHGSNAPGAVAADGARVWVTNIGGNSVTELDAKTGALVRVLAGPSYGFNYPGAVAADGARVWVANADGNSVTEFPASSQLPAPRTPVTTSVCLPQPPIRPAHPRRRGSRRAVGALARPAWRWSTRTGPGAAAIAMGNRFGLQDASPWARITVLTCGRLLSRSPDG